VGCKKEHKIYDIFSSEHDRKAAKAIIAEVWQVVWTVLIGLLIDYNYILNDHYILNYSCPGSRRFEANLETPSLLTDSHCLSILALIQGVGIGAKEARIYIDRDDQSAETESKIIKEGGF
jgi:hypothetical protein